MLGIISGSRYRIARDLASVVRLSIIRPLTSQLHYSHSTAASYSHNSSDTNNINNNHNVIFETDNAIRDDDKLQYLEVQLSKLDTNSIISPYMTEFQMEQVFNSFLLSIDTSYSSANWDNINRTVTLWNEAFQIQDSTNECLGILQKRLVGERQKFVIFLMNHAKYNLYKQSVLKLYSTHKLFRGLNLSRSEELFNILKFQDDFVDSLALERYCLDDQIPIDERRHALTTMLRKGLLNGKNDEDYHRLYIETFFTLYPKLEGSFVGFGERGTQIYQKALNILITVPNFTHIVKQHFPENMNKEYGNILSYFLELLVKFHQTKIALSIWNEKIGTNGGATLIPRDLTNIMQTTFDAGNFVKTLEIYQNWQHLLKDDSQITILLGIAEKERDWKALQKQFEDMYGKGSLPHDIHYAIVMNALASIGAREEVHTLFNQLLRRNLVPNSGIVAALVNTELFHGNYKQAEDLIIKYTDPSNSSDIASDYLYQFIFTKFFRSNDLETAMKWFNRICEDKKSFHLLNKESIRALISLCRKNYSLQNLEHIWQTIQQNPKLFQHISNQDIYVEMIKTYTKFSLYEKANELSNQALDETASIHPYLCGNLYTAKLANYLRWLQDRQQFLNVHQKDLIHKLIQSLIKAYNDNNIFQQSYWYVTLMKYYIFRDNNIEIAVEILKYLQKTHIQILNEQHYHPIMQFYLKDGDFNEVLEIFKKMMSNEVTASTLSHLWLIQALLKLDRMKGTNFNNSTNLLKAVYEMNGLQIQGNNESTNLKNSQTPKGQLYQNAEVLTNITMSYIVSKNDGDGENLLFNFLEQIKENTNEKITNTFKYPLYKNIYKYYMNRGNEVQAVALIENIFEDLRRTIMKYVSEKTAVRCYDESIPRYLEEHFQYFFNIKLEQFEAKKRSKNTLNELLELSKVVKDCQVQLTNHSQNNLVHALLKNGTSGFQEALSICEEYLTAGNWKLISVEKSKKYILKALMYYLSDHSDTSMLKGKYKLLLDYYAVKLENLNETFEPLKLTKIGLLMKTLDSYNRRFSENDAVSVQGLLDKEYEFFNPPSSKYDTFMIRQSTSNILTQRFNQYYKSKGKVEVFKLMDKFPLTIEYLLTSDSSKKRSDKFMDQINRRESPPISDVHETHKSRNERIIRVLKLIQEENHPEREHNTINY